MLALVPTITLAKRFTGPSGKRTSVSYGDDGENDMRGLNDDVSAWSTPHVAICDSGGSVGAVADCFDFEETAAAEEEDESKYCTS